MTDVQPGAFAVINTGTRATPFIQFGEFLCTLFDARPQIPEWDHAVICSRIGDDGTMYIVEAQPGGAVEVPWHYNQRPHQWSTGLVEMPGDAGVAARRYIGVGYSFLDYAAMTTHELHVPAPGLRAYIASTHHMICSQLVDRAALDAGKHLFTDNRWEGYVKPSDLGFLLAAA